jgi:hypothetical protein
MTNEINIQPSLIDIYIICNSLTYNFFVISLFSSVDYWCFFLHEKTMFKKCKNISGINSTCEQCLKFAMSQQVQS